MCEDIFIAKTPIHNIRIVLVDQSHENLERLAKFLHLGACRHLKNVCRAAIEFTLLN